MIFAKTASLMNRARRRGLTTRTAVFVASLATVVAACVLIPSILKFVTQYEREFEEEITRQQKWVESTKAAVQKGACEFIKDFASQQSISLNSGGRAVLVNTNKSLNFLRNAPHINRYEAVNSDASGQSISNKCSSLRDAKWSWIPIRGSPPEDLTKLDHNWLSEAGSYTLVGFVGPITTLPTDGGLGNNPSGLFPDGPVTAAREERWGIVAVPAPGSAIRPLQWAGLAAIFVIFAAVAVLVYNLINLNRPLLALEQAADNLAETLTSGKKRVSGQNVAAFLQDMRPMDTFISRRGHTAIEAFGTMHEQLVALLRLQEDALGKWSHDLRNRVHDLRRQVTNHMEDTRARIVSLEFVDQIDAMMGDALYLVAGRHTRETRKWVDLYSLLFKLVDMAQERYGNMTFDSTTRDVVVEAALDALTRAFDNLVRNAILHGGKTEVTVSLSTTHKTAIIEIADRGPGLPADVNVMEPFVRGDTARSTQTGGAGLGLTIAHDIIQAHGGSIVLSNRVGGGVVARVELPLGRPGRVTNHLSAQDGKHRLSRARDSE